MAKIEPMGDCLKCPVSIGDIIEVRDEIYAIITDNCRSYSREYHYCRHDFTFEDNTCYLYGSIDVRYFHIHTINDIYA